MKDVPPHGFIMQSHTVAAAPRAAHSAGESSATPPTAHLLLAISTATPYTLQRRELYPRAMHRGGDAYVVHTFGTPCANGSAAFLPLGGGGGGGGGACLAAWDGRKGGLRLHTGAAAATDPAGYTPWALLTLYPMETGSWLILGELGKFVHLSPTRFSTLSAPSFCVVGDPGEVVAVSALSPAGKVATMGVAVPTATPPGAPVCASF